MPPSDTWRAPQLLVLVDGVPLATAFEATVQSLGGFCANAFRVRAALAGDAVAWAARTGAAIDVQVALGPPGGFTSLVQGAADCIGIDPIEGVLTLEGRDYAAALIEARTQETFANRTSSEIATLLAGRHNLAADVQATTTPVGRYWELEHDSLTLNAGARATTEWDLLATLAGWEGFDLWVCGTTLHFRAPDTLGAPPLLARGDFASLRLSRALAFAGDLAVTVKSWHSRAGGATTQTARTARGAAGARDFVFVVPNLTADAALLLAERRLAEIAGHELLLLGEMPGELSLAPRAFFRLASTDTLFDTVWRIDEVERRISPRHGFTQMVRASAASTS